MSHPVVHPMQVEELALIVLVGHTDEVWLNNVPGMPTLFCLGFRCTQLVCTTIAFTFLASADCTIVPIFWLVSLLFSNQEITFLYNKELMCYRMPGS
jgi:hypothetical protein